MDERTSSLVLRKCIAIILSEIGINAIEIEALNFLCILARAYIERVFHDSQCFAEAGGRSRPNLNDIHSGIIRYGKLKIDKKNSRFKVEIDVKDYLDKNFSTNPDVALRSIITDSEANGRHRELLWGKKSKPAHVPSYFPSFPSAHTYKYTANAAFELNYEDENDKFKQNDLDAENKKTLEENIIEIASQLLSVKRKRILEEKDHDQDDVMVAENVTEAVNDKKHDINESSVPPAKRAKLETRINDILPKELLSTANKDLSIKAIDTLQRLELMFIPANYRASLKD